MNVCLASSSIVIVIFIGFYFSYDYLDIFKGGIANSDDLWCDLEERQGGKAPCKVGRFCGTNSPGKIFSKLDPEEESNLILQFNTDYSVRKEGFQFTYRQIG